MDSIMMVVSRMSHPVQTPTMQDVRLLQHEERMALLSGPTVTLRHRVLTIEVPKRALMAFSPVLNSHLVTQPTTSEIRFDYEADQVTTFAFKAIVQFMNECIVLGQRVRLDHGYCVKNAIEMYRFGRLLGWTTYLEDISSFLEEQLPCPSKGEIFGRMELALFQTLDSQDMIYRRLVDILERDQFGDS
ncbi:uncharacterized protein EI97DRAFT_475298 [Westerdykella ornata]|uniref:BTB domain-containing protein n=1 Tax=Westerdykella ornata TaxID=318751 RepID=A0A6A6JG11_WESOR|nr:uncharacterized protein EI97DRAFT_475298 [Westerdykella ornata]KAF2275352.1 hypothetical protein EI97DRAFT_475298 [Westerdykella ornata]